MDKMEAPMALMVETGDGLDVGMLNFTRFVLTQGKFPTQDKPRQHLAGAEEEVMAVM